MLFDSVFLAHRRWLIFIIDVGKLLTVSVMR
jgi:hypothetical protein